MNLSNQEDLTKIKKFSFMFIVLFMVLGFYQSIIITSLSLYMKKDKWYGTRYIPDIPWSRIRTL